MNKRSSLKYGLLLSILFIISDLETIEKILFSAGGILLKDMLIMSIFLFFTYQSIKKLRFDKYQEYTFWKGYGKGISIGLTAIGFYLLMNIILIGVKNISIMDFIKGIMGITPKLIAESALKLFLIIIFAFFIPIYLLIRNDKTKSGELDELLFKD
jgi:hypothetical protein